MSRQAKLAGPIRAEAKVSVDRHESEPFDDTNEPLLAELRLWERFSGQIEGESIVRALQVRNGDGSVSQVSLQRVAGSLGGRKGTFVLQGSGTVQGGDVGATWFVVPGSATDDLAGLRGKGGFEGTFGKGSTATLEYWFE
jgi:uncharacterized protein DUF3224